MYIYLITHQMGMPGDTHYFKGLYQQRPGEQPTAMFGRTGKPKTYTSHVKAEKAIQRMQDTGGFTNLGYSLYDRSNLRIKEIDLHSNCVMEFYP